MQLIYLPAIFHLSIIDLAAKVLLFIKNITIIFKIADSKKE